MLCVTLQADIAVLPFLERFSVLLPHYRGYDPLAVDERLRAWLNAARQRPAFQETTLPAEDFIKGYGGYVNPPKQ